MYINYNSEITLYSKYFSSFECNFASKYTRMFVSIVSRVLRLCIYFVANAFHAWGTFAQVLWGVVHRVCVQGGAHRVCCAGGCAQGCCAGGCAQGVYAGKCMYTGCVCRGVCTVFLCRCVRVCVCTRSVCRSVCVHWVPEKALHHTDWISHASACSRQSSIHRDFRINMHPGPQCITPFCALETVYIVSLN